MFEGVLGLSNAYSEISLQKLSMIVQEPKPLPLQRLVDATLDQCFQPDTFPQHAVDKQAMGPITRADFFAALRKTLTRYLKKYARTIEELALHRERYGGAREWLRELMERIQIITVKVYKYIRVVETSYRWENCKSALCDDKRSFVVFQRDVISFITDVTDHGAKNIKEAIKNNEINHPFLPGEAESLGRPGVTEIELQMEEGCEELHGKQKKKKKKKKSKQPPKQQPVQAEEVSEQEKELVAFLSSLVIQDEQRERCLVPQEWIADISPSSFFKQ